MRSRLVAKALCGTVNLHVDQLLLPKSEMTTKITKLANPGGTTED